MEELLGNENINLINSIWNHEINQYKIMYEENEKNFLIFDRYNFQNNSNKFKKKVQQAVMNFARPTKNIIEFPERNNNERSLRTLQTLQTRQKKSFYIFDEKLGRKRRHDPFFSSLANPKIMKINKNKISLNDTKKKIWKEENPIKKEISISEDNFISNVHSAGREISDDIVHVNSNIPNYNYFEKFPFLTELMKNEINIHEQISSDNSNDYGCKTNTITIPDSPLLSNNLFTRMETPLMESNANIDNNNGENISSLDWINDIFQE